MVQAPLGYTKLGTSSLLRHVPSVLDFVSCFCFTTGMSLHHVLSNLEESAPEQNALRVPEAAMNELARLIAEAQVYLSANSLLEATSALAAIPPVLEPLSDLLRQRWFQETSEPVETSPYDDAPHCGLYL